jgi:hypothetical protein
VRTVTHVVAALTIAFLLRPTPALATPDEQTSLRAVANIARLALGPTCTDPDTAPWTLGPPPPGYFDGGTPNQKMLVRVWHYGWALRTGAPDLSTIRSTLLDFINRQQQAGGASGGPLGHYATQLGANEELTSTHYQLWAGAMAAAYLYAIANGGPLSGTNTPETAIRDAVRRWWSDEQALYDVIYTNGQLVAPGARFPNLLTTDPVATNILRDDIYKLLLGQVPAKTRTCSADRFYTSSFVMQALKTAGIPRLGQPPTGYTPSPKLYDTLCVYRMGSDWTLYFPNMRGVTGALYWTESRGGAVAHAVVPYDGVKPTAYLPNSASLTSIPGQVAGAATCPPPDLLHQ